MSGIVESSSPDLYWYQLSAYGAPYAALGNFVLNVVPLPDADQSVTEDQALKKLEELRLQFDQLRKSIAGQVTDQRVIKLTNTILALKEVLDEYASSRSPALLSDVQTRSAVAKQTIMGLLNSGDTPIAYYYVYSTLFCMLIALRVTVFVLQNLQRRALYEEVCQEIQDVLRFEDRAIDVARQVGRNRVSNVNEKLFLVDELGPVWGTTFTIKVDGKVVYVDEFSGIREHPRRNIADVRAQADRVHDELAARQADIVSADLRRYYDTADAVKAIVCA